MTAEIEMGLVAIVAALLFGGGFYVGNLRATDEARVAQAAQLTQVVKTYEQQLSAAQAAYAAQQKVVDAYDAIKDMPDPASAGLATRVLLRACPAGGGDVSQAPAVAGGTHPPAQEPGGDPSLGGRLQAVIDACTADSRQLEAVIELAPK